MRLALFGGTFDPIHVAHLIIAEFARQQLGANKILFVPSSIPPHKKNNSIASAQHRLMMVKSAIKGNDFFKVSDLEMQRDGTSYTVDTLNEIAGSYRLEKENLFLIVGADNFLDMNSWFEPKRISEICRLVVAGRPDYTIHQSIKRQHHDVIFLETPFLDISSSTIREMIRQNQSIKYMVPDNVAEYISTHDLYR